MKKGKLLSSLMLCGVLACSTTSCSNSVSPEEANKKLTNAAQKTEVRLKDELNKDMFYFEINYSTKTKFDVTEIYEEIETNIATEEVVSKTSESENASQNSTSLIEVFGNFDKNYYLDLEGKLPKDNKTDIFAHIKETNNATYNGESQEEVYDVAYRYIQSELGMVESQYPTGVANVTLPEELDATIGMYLASIIETLNAPKDETTEEMSLEEVVLMLARNTNDMDVIAMVEYIVEEYDLENLTSEDIVEIFTHLLGSNPSVSSAMLTPTLKSYMVDSLDDIKALDTSKLIDITTDEKGGFTYYNYDLNYKELKSYINKVIKVLNDNSTSLTGNEKVLVTTLVTSIDEGVKAMLPKSLDVGYGIGIKNGAIMAFSVDFSIKGLETTSESTPSLNTSSSTYVKEVYTTKINEMTYSLDFSFDFADKAYSIPALNEYFKN